MSQSNVLRRMAVPSLVGGALFCGPHVYAQQEGQIQLEPNERVIQSWQQNSPGSASPALTREDDGSTRLEWKGGLALDAYTNDIVSAGGNLTTPLRTGAFYKNIFSSDLRAIHRNNVVDFFQLGTTSSNDLSVLSQRRYQINNLQLGRAGQGYSLSVGDVAPNFSSLGSALGVRGLFGQREFAGMTAYGFTGVVAESWEALDDKVPRTQYLKDVYGVKLERAFGESLKTFVTTQGSSEREPTTVLLQPPVLARGKTRSLTGGFQYQQAQFTLNGETAGSSYEDDGTANRQGRASILDALWRGDGYALRGGYHDISTGYTSLSLQVQPGIREAYVGADWTVAPWIALGTDVRRSRASTRATIASTATFVDTDAVAARGNINFGPDYPGWAIAVQQAQSRSINTAAQVSRNSDFSTALNYASQSWSSGIGFGNGKVISEVSPASDSVNNNWAFNLGRNFSDALPDLAQTWNAGISFSAGAQTQRLLAGGVTTSSNYSLALTAQRARGGSINFLITGGQTTQPNGGPALRIEGLQLEAGYPVSAKAVFKVYMRSSRRNIDDPVLSTKENVAGLQLAVTF